MSVIEELPVRKVRRATNDFGLPAGLSVYKDIEKRNGRSCGVISLRFRVAAFGESSSRSFTFSKDTYDEKFEEALDELLKVRPDTDMRFRAPTWFTVMKKLGLRSTLSGRIKPK